MSHYSSLIYCIFSPIKISWNLGPWIENLFISEYMNKPLSFFNGLIPLFIQWIDTDILSKQEAININTFLTKELRKDVLYVAISQVRT